MFLRQGGPPATPALPGSSSLGLSGFIANRGSEFNGISTKSETNYSTVREPTIPLKSLVKYPAHPIFMILGWFLAGTHERDTETQSRDARLRNSERNGTLFLSINNDILTRHLYQKRTRKEGKETPFPFDRTARAGSSGERIFHARIFAASLLQPAASLCPLNGLRGAS